MSSLPTYSFQLDPALLAQAQAVGNTDVQVDPALFELAKIVDDARRGRLSFDIDEGVQLGEEEEGVVQLEEEITGLEEDVPMEDEIDPALREIVNSLTAAQQPRTATAGMTQAEAAVAINALLSEGNDVTRAEGPFDVMAHATFGSIFPNEFPRQSDADNFLLPDPHAESSTASHSNALPTQALRSPYKTANNTHAPQPPASRGRGRPLGSKNRPKPPHLVKPKPPKPPARKRGRPYKIRTAEELAAIEKKRSDRELGLTRGKGRPRKFDGYLVREMRLKKNREEYLNLIRGWEEGGRQGQRPEEGQEDGQGLEGVEGEGEGEGEEEDDGEQDEGGMTLDQAEEVERAYWGHSGQSLLEAVENLNAGNDEEGSDVGDSLEATREEDADLRHVFGLPAV